MEFRTKLGKIARIAVAGTVIAVAGTSVGGALNGESAGKRYTGCITSTGGLSQLKAGDSPKSACTTGQTKVTLGNGDITGILAGTGLTGGGDQGTPTLGLHSNYALPQGCATGAPAKRSAVGWYCGSDNGTFSKTVGGLTADLDRPPSEGKCVGDYDVWNYSPPTPGDSSMSSSAFTLPTGTYLPTMVGTTRWFVNRTYDMFDGEQFSSGSVRIRLVRTRSGVASTVATWARSHSENSDGTGLPYNQDPGIFTTLSTDSYRLVAEAGATYCTRARVLDAGMDFTRVG
ncbi:MAG TPA: hypothetical protein VNC41_12650 [Acidimicrobiia bacterium]|nr:hypothetical protein [Acidimicrobiia bacterium]